MPDRRGAHDPGRVVTEGGVIRVADPDGGRQRRRESDGPVVAEGLGGPGLGGDVAAGQRQVAVAAEGQAAVTVVRHDGADDERDLLADGAVFVLGWVISEDVL